ncbi:MAG: YbaB/EbfC family nucleoid-associated protein [Oscillospiraceae bacterium]
MKARLPQGYNNSQGNMIKQAQKIQEEMAKFQEELDEKEFTASAGGGAVTITMLGKKEVSKLEIKPEVIDPDDKEMLEDLIVAATNECLRTIEEYSNEGMSNFTGGLSIPGLF